MPPAIAYVNEQPELMGLAAAQDFTVCASSQCTAEEKATTVESEGKRMSCPNNCSKAGLCDTSSGTCVCDIGFAGADCSTYTV